MIYNAFVHVFCICLFTVRTEDDVHLASKAKADQIERLRCGYNLMKLWTAEVAHSPFAATPLITDVNANGMLDIIAAPLSETQTVLEAETGTTLKNTKWPTQMLDSSIFASPLQYDIDGDGMLDIMFSTSSGELLFYTGNGTAVQGKFMQVPPVYVKQDWYTQVVAVSAENMQQYISSTRRAGYIPVDAHIMATPVIADLNNDDRMQELVIPVSYFFDEEDYRLPENFDHINNIGEGDLGKYVVSGVTVIDLSDLSVQHSIYLDLTMKTSGFPGYVLFSPTVIDMDRNGSHLEIVIGTSAGGIHVINLENGVRDRSGFPYSMGTIHGQVTVADITKDGTLELIAIDTSGNVVCVNQDGTLFWEAKISGENSPGSRLIDIDGDGYVEVLIPTNEGDVYAISGVTGKVLDGWPIHVGHPILSNVIATRVSRTRQTLDLVFLANDGALHVISTDQSCRTHFPIGETSLVQILSHDLVAQSEGMELLIATSDGTLICMGSGEETNEKMLSDNMFSKTHALSLPAETRSANDFLFAELKLSVQVLGESRHHSEITASHFHVDFNITDPAFIKPDSVAPLYTLWIYFGSMMLHKAVYSNPGPYTVFVSSYPRPSHGHITLVLTNKNGQIAQDMFPIRFNQIILEDLQWLLMAPFVAMVIILLVNHGFPAKDLIPITLQSKDR
ncbi:uncharacterized protein LOC127869338 isoform X2 [Dreissena polymorpha]|uniref:uncharacterized protein LOC127869338 isoform X2 n=1 Tax=Dreissena polymorpha TaxID=45954 RepID=UPI002263F68C|nr:uncharacterized protein LOC127869338 isoform X2 [Dreissena polymorpha]